MRRIHFEVIGDPAPQGSKRHIGLGVMIESSKKVKPWRESVKWAAFEHYKPENVFRGAVDLSITFTLAKPKSAPKSRRTWPSRKPDLDKLIRSTCDAISDAGLWEDDARVVRMSTQKIYAGDDGGLPVPGARIWIAEVE